MSSTRLLGITVYGHFTSAAAVLGLAPFYGLTLAALGTEHAALAGLFFVIPTLGAALASPLWGALADRVGKKPALIRAHLGLAAAFLIASYAQNVWHFAIALAIQGLFGGSFAASNALLATVWRGAALARVLTLMQGSARLALFAGPALIGWGMGLAAPLQLYRYLALLPLVAAVLVWCLPSAAPTAPAGSSADAPSSSAAVPAAFVYLFNYALVFATVLGFPYFTSFCTTRLGMVSPALSGLLYGLPHAVYLAAAGPGLRLLQRPVSSVQIGFALLLTAAASAAHLWCFSLSSLVVARLALGLAMTACYLLINSLAASLTSAGDAGRRFGNIEASTKWGAVCAGLCASLLSAWLTPAACFAAGALILILAAAALTLFTHARQPIASHACPMQLEKLE